MDLKFDLDDLFSEENYKKLAIHVWQHHDESDQGIPLKQTLQNGPGEEE
jgi:hypothetical protein